MEIVKMPFRIALALLFLISPSVHAAQNSKSLDKELQRIVAGKDQSLPIAGAALAVMAGGKLVYSGAAGCAAFGVDGKSCARPLLATSKLHVASISKMALAMGVMTLVEDGYYAAFGLGVQTVHGNEFLAPGFRFIGHAGEAYGLYSGAWLLEADTKAISAKDISFASAAIGVSETPARGSHPTFNAIEEKLVRLAMRAAETDDSLDDDEPRPFDEETDAMQAVDAALLAAKANGKRPLLIFGGNWCHDSRGLAKKFEVEPLRSLIASNYVPVWVDVGHRDKNLGVASRFGVEKLLGTPTVLILSPGGELLNAESVHDWRNADSKTLEEAIDYFESFADSER